MNFARRAIALAIATNYPRASLAFASSSRIKQQIVGNMSFGGRTKACATNNYDSDTPSELPTFDSRDDYMDYIMKASGLPLGFSTGSAVGSFIPEEAPAMGSLPIKGTVIHVEDGPTESWAATFTQNKFPGSPIKVGKERLSSGNPIQTIFVNNKVSNVCSGGDGVADAEHVCEAVAEALGLAAGKESVFPSSTGVIGWKLPAKELASDVVPKAVGNLQSESAFSAARDIMTTDRFPKLRSKTLSNGARIVGIAKVTTSCMTLS
jgi:glutamate N-acetyltransferase/amino-acid N-acetyltransferase